MNYSSVMKATVYRFGGPCISPSYAQAGRARSALRASATSPSPEKPLQLTPRTLAQTLLSDKSYDIVFHGYLHNHVKHAVIALHGLQAPAEVIQRYWDMCASYTCVDSQIHVISCDFGRSGGTRKHQSCRAVFEQMQTY